MAYFANGSVGDSYEYHWCNRCAHERDAEKGECCPIWMLHMLWNYDQARDADKQLALDLFIPRDGLVNMSCEMFVEKPPPLVR